MISNTEFLERGKEGDIEMSITRTQSGIIDPCLKHFELVKPKAWLMKPFWRIHKSSDVACGVHSNLCYKETLEPHKKCSRDDIYNTILSSVILRTGVCKYGSTHTLPLDAPQTQQSSRSLAQFGIYIVTHSM